MSGERFWFSSLPAAVAGPLALEANGVSTWARRSHPINGREGLAIKGFLPKKHAHRYQIRTAATRSNFPTMKNALRTVAMLRHKPTASGEFHSQNTLGKARISGLRELWGRAPAEENNSVPQGSNATKC